ncbi:unnamed protein product [Ilex paraguariensis]|uniref:HTH cro/C1-type domain-containing protein n=1 Tax=Ilex paraguariensis TaxID=185542 RepID=A0ABC8QN83_9AQUA
MQAHMDKKLTQSQLAQISLCLCLSLSLSLSLSLICMHSVLRLYPFQIINEKPQIIQEYESGKAIPNQQIISKLERALGVKLRGRSKRSSKKES